ncbi:MAG: LPS export ABC transporter periplasmic protein LptC [Burkholderiaceae bacterium]|jgi:lipopolysaccharide export system protein LptC|nr:LPS export ABC transporter periplasmic protein LptC [Burkholderiaceae bacterium]
MKHLSRRWRDWLSAWLPVLCMAFFALGTLWLVRSAPMPPAAQPAGPPGHDPDYFMRQFAVRQFDDQGRMTSELFGVEGQHYPDIDKLAVQTPRWRAYDAQGRLITGHSTRAMTNREGSEVELFGDAQIVREPLPPGSQPAKAAGKADPPLTFSGPYLHAWSQQRRVSSNQPVTLTRGADVFTGDQFDYDDHSGIANLQGRVRGVIQPSH